MRRVLADLERVERHVGEHDQPQDHGEPGADRVKGEPPRRQPSLQPGEDRQEGPARPVAQESDADRHIGKVIPQREREDPRQGDLEQQDRRGDEGDPEVEGRMVAVRQRHQTCVATPGLPASANRSTFRHTAGNTRARRRDICHVRSAACRGEAAAPRAASSTAEMSAATASQVKRAAQRSAPAASRSRSA